MKKSFSGYLVLLVLVLLQPVAAQAPGAASTQRTTAEQTPPVEDPLGRSTPQGTVVGLITAAEQANLDRAAEYLAPVPRLPNRAELARKLRVVLDRKLFTSLDSVSDQPDGDPGDGLTNRDRIGLVESPSGNVEVFLDRVQRGQGAAIWLFSASTLQEIPRLFDEVQPPWIERYLPERLRTIRWLSLPLYTWLAILLLVPLAFGLARLSARALTVLLRPLFRRLTREQDDKLASAGPVRLLVLGLFFYTASFFGLTLATRQFWYRVAVTLAVIALCWFSLRLVDVLAELSVRRLQRFRRSGDTALVRLIGRLLKAATVTVAALVLLFLMDFDLTPALTGLGVGGLAIGFGAQKTIENLFGGIMVISDKPVNVGDVCRAGEFFGTVEDIGIRSTRIRTLDRTVVAVPNGLLSAMSLENFALRDRMRFQHTVGLGHQTTTEQLRHVLAEIRRLLDARPQVDSASARARFIRFSGASLDIEIFAYVLETDHEAFLAIQEELLLGIMDIIDASGTSVAQPLWVRDLSQDRGPDTQLLKAGAQRRQ